MRSLVLALVLACVLCGYARAHEVRRLSIDDQGEWVEANREFWDASDLVKPQYRQLKDSMDKNLSCKELRKLDQADYGTLIEALDNLKEAGIQYLQHLPPADPRRKSVEFITNDSGTLAREIASLLERLHGKITIKCGQSSRGAEKDASFFIGTKQKRGAQAPRTRFHQKTILYVSGGRVQRHSTKSAGKHQGKLMRGTTSSLRSGLVLRGDALSFATMAISLGGMPGLSVAYPERLSSEAGAHVSCDGSGIFCALRAGGRR